MAGRQLSDEVLAEAESLLSEGVSYREVASQLGTTPVTLYKRFPQFRRKKPDPTPGGAPAKGEEGPRKPPKIPKAGITDDKLVEFYSKIAVAPSVPMLLLADCEFCASHFTKTGPAAAVQLVTMSKDNAPLRAVLESGYAALTKGMWAGVLLMYAGVPIAHHLAPDNVYRALAFFNVLPDKGEVTTFHDSHTRTAPETFPNATADEDDEPEEPFTGFEGADTDQLMQMAKGFGIELDPNMVALAARMFEEAGSVEPVINVTAEDIDDADTPTESESEQQADAEAADAASAAEAAQASETDSFGNLPLP